VIVATEKTQFPSMADIGTSTLASDAAGILAKCGVRNETPQTSGSLFLMKYFQYTQGKDL